MSQHRFKNSQRGVKNVSMRSRPGSRTNRNRRRRNRGTGLGKSIRRGGTSAITSLTAISAFPKQVRSIRYHADINTADTVTVTVEDAQNLLLSVISSSTGAFSIIEGARILDVGLTVMPNSSSGAGSLSFNWEGERTAPTNETLIFSQGAPSKWNFRPPMESLASFWINNTDDPTTFTSPYLFSIDIRGTVELYLDLHFEYIVLNGAGLSATLSSAATFSGVAYSTIGTTSPGSSHSGFFVPVGLNYVNFTSTL